VDTKANRAKIEMLYIDLESTSTQINASIFRLVFCCLPCPALTPHSFMQNLVEHSHSKVQFMRVAIKRLTETQLFVDELKEVSEMNTVLLACNQELKAQLVKESREQSGTCSVDFP
jgi:phospholipid N-methyltransferase